jgi:hypothetical protein
MLWIPFQSGFSTMCAKVQSCSLGYRVGGQAALGGPGAESCFSTCELAKSTLLTVTRVRASLPPVLEGDTLHLRVCDSRSSEADLTFSVSVSLMRKPTFAAQVRSSPVGREGKNLSVFGPLISVSL